MAKHRSLSLPYIASGEVVVVVVATLAVLVWKRPVLRCHELARIPVATLATHTCSLRHLLSQRATTEWIHTILDQGHCHSTRSPEEAQVEAGQKPFWSASSRPACQTSTGLAQSSS